MTKFMSNMNSALCVSLLCLITGFSNKGVLLTGIRKKWHPLTFTFDGPMTVETSARNPFLSYRLNVRFIHKYSQQSHVVPGYYAADGDAANTGAKMGRKWRAHFTPPRAGEWKLIASFRTGNNIAISLNPNDGRPVYFDGVTHEFHVKELSQPSTPKNYLRDHRRKGVLRYIGKRYLQFDNGEYFLKGGADSPENFLAFQEFDNTYSKVKSRTKTYAPHVKDWRKGDPTWKGNKGKGIIGALNYLASTGANAFSFLTFNVHGDGNDVWPWVSPHDFLRYDVSKLDQWNIVFSHADTLGLFMHFKTQETENDLLLDNGALGKSRKLYYRELIARFGHHHALNWNLGEENDIWFELNDKTQRHVKSYIEYVHKLDSYRHPVVIHSYPTEIEKVFSPLLGKKPNLDGMSLQTHWSLVHSKTLQWLSRSRNSGKQWVVCNDEQNSANNGVLPDGPGSNRDIIRREVLWGNLMAGGAGVEYYFGYQHPHNDLNANDWRSRHLAWQDINIALGFFRKYIPFTAMEPAQFLARSPNVYVFAKHQNTYVYYFTGGPTSKVKIPKGRYYVRWFNPRKGGLFAREKKTLYGPQNLDLKLIDAQDWVMLLRVF